MKFRIVKLSEIAKHPNHSLSPKDYLMSDLKHYRGWDYNFDPKRPVSGQWRATRAGVGMNTNSEKGLKRMIDQKLHLEAEKRIISERHGQSVVENLKRNVRLDLRPDILHHDKSYLLPDAVSFDELFTVIGEPQRWPFTPTIKDTMKISSWIRFRDAAHGHPVEQVKPSPEVFNALRANMLDLGSRDEVSFEIIVHDNGWALVLVQHSQIIGSRWIAYIDAATLPLEGRS